MERRRSQSEWLAMLVTICSLVPGAWTYRFKFHRAANMDGILSSTAPLFYEASISDLNCARLCSKRFDCQAVTFVGDRSGSCYGYSLSVGSEDTQGTIVSGAKTYHIPPARSCEELVETGRTAGTIELWTDPNTFHLQALCDGPWLVFQRRQSGNVDFFRGWQDYREGFGDPQDEYWLGLETVRQLTSQGSWNLRVDLRDKVGDFAYAMYSNFRLGSEDRFYTLLYDSYISGTEGDSLEYHRGRPFSTKDSDHDDKGGNCAVEAHGAWWYGRCHHSNLNGDYNNDAYAMGLTWFSWKGHSYSLLFTQMKIQKV